MTHPTSPPPHPPRPQADDRGSTTVEIAFAIPTTILLLLLIITSGRYATALIDVQSTAGAAARAASLARSPAAAHTAADDTTQTLTGCTHRENTLDTSAFRPGGHITVALRCTISTNTLTGFDLPGSLTAVATASSPIDVYRTVVTDTP